jgi:hypothetical protein
MLWSTSFILGDAKSLTLLATPGEKLKKMEYKCGEVFDIKKRNNKNC